MEPEYDFSNGVRGKFFVEAEKSEKPFYLDSDLRDFYTRQAEATGQSIDELIMKVLRDAMDSQTNES